jgi:hypothetical protein
VPASLLLLRFARQTPPEGVIDGIAVSAVMPPDVDALQPLWQSWHGQQSQAAPELGPYVAANVSWDRVKAGLQRAAGTGWLFRAGPADRPIGLVSIVLSDAGAFADTWITNGPRVAEITILLAGAGDRPGIARGLLQFADRHLAGLGITDLMVNAMPWDGVVLEACRDRGFQPGWLQLKRVP